MYLFTRSRRIRPGSILGGVDWAVAATELVRKTTGREVNGWISVMSPEAETVTWSMWAEAMGDVVEAGDKLATSAAWADLLQRGLDHFDGPLVDGLAELVFGVPDLEAGPPDYVSVVSAVAANGRLSDAIAAGVELAEHTTKVTGHPALFAVNTTGVFGGVGWIVPAPDIGAVDAARAALMADSEWLPLIDRVGTAYAPGAAQSLHRRIA
jgi:hypothetical protein